MNIQFLKNNKKLIIILSLVLLLIISIITTEVIITKNKHSTATATTLDYVNVGETNILKRTIPVIIKDSKKTTITYVGCTDSRCPSGVECSNLEELRFTFELVNERETKKFSLSSKTDKEVEVAGYKFTYMSGNIRQVSIKIENT